jgi:hypothetical protein
VKFDMGTSWLGEGKVLIGGSKEMEPPGVKPLV